jgi:divalent metal cation (Fe/Co/Zn/Cd) transporter
MNSTKNISKHLKLALILITITLAYNFIESFISLSEALSKKSLALTGFGFDAIIEIIAASLVLIRFLREIKNGSRSEIKKLEKVIRKIIGITFFILASYVIIQSSIILYLQKAPLESLTGIILSIVSLTIMPFIAFKKIKLAKKLKSEILLAEAKETLACSYLSFCLLLGLSFNYLLGWWWMDPIFALIMVPWLIKEGLENVR